MRFDCYEQLLMPRGAAVCEIDHPPPPGTDIECDGPIRGTIKLTNVGRYVRAVGALRAAVRLSCSRCTAPVQQRLEAAVDEECALTQIDEPDAYDGGTEDVDALPILDDDVIDLSELVRQNTLVSLPPVILCRPDCMGLCSECGKNLNEGPCDCSTERIDPRLAKLAELLGRDGGEGGGSSGPEG
ncbi:MAG: DUF177 domain-containing protein [Armatimonadota bacterium]|jgi:uncharacterized protein